MWNIKGKENMRNVEIRNRKQGENPKRQREEYHWRKKEENEIMKVQRKERDKSEEAALKKKIE